MTATVCPLACQKSADLMGQFCWDSGDAPTMVFAGVKIGAGSQHGLEARPYRRWRRGRLPSFGKIVVDFLPRRYLMQMHCMPVPTALTLLYQLDGSCTSVRGSAFADG